MTIVRRAPPELYHDMSHDTLLTIAALIVIAIWSAWDAMRR